jgi:hypothetical protein
VFADGLTTPVNLTFISNGGMLVADSGITVGNGKVLKDEGSFLLNEFH